MENILQRIDEFLSKKDNTLCKNEILTIIDYLIEDVPADIVYLQAFRDSVNDYWSSNNSVMFGNFKKILSTYGIMREQIERRSVLELKGKHIVKKFVELKHKNEIQTILKKK